MESDIEHIFLIVIDCCRQDYLYASNAETPFLDALAQEAATFTNAFSQINSTISSHVTVFTSKYPCDHGVYSNFQKPTRGGLTLPALLERSDWKTLALTGVGFLSWLMGDWCSYNQTVSWIPALEDPDKRGYGLRKIGIVKARRSATGTVSKLVSHLKKGLKKEFFWIHFFDAHLPYRSPKKFLRKHYRGKTKADTSAYEKARDLGLFVSHGTARELSSRRPFNFYQAAYRASIEYIDSEIGRLIRFLKCSGIWSRSLFIVTSDHGENLAGNGVFCDHSKLFDETIKVPLYWRDPAIKGEKEIDALVQHVDIYPSILGRLGIEVPAAIRGESVYPLMEGTSKKVHDFAFSEHANNYQYTVRTEDWQYIWKNTEREHPEGLELEDDFLINRRNSKRGERYESLASHYPEICQELRGLGETILSLPIRDDSESYIVSQSVEEVLKGWGYL